MDYYEKVIDCLDDNGEQTILQGKKKKTSVKMVTAIQTKRSRRKGCVLFEVHNFSEKRKEVKDADVLKNYLVLQQFQDVFPAKILELSPHREVLIFGMFYA